MKLAWEQTDSTLTVLLQGEIDHHTARTARTAMDAEIERVRPSVLYLDLSELSFMDSSGIGLIMGRYRLMKSLGGSLFLIHVPPTIDRLIRLGGLDKLPIREKQPVTEKTT